MSFSFSDRRSLFGQNGSALSRLRLFGRSASVALNKRFRFSRRKGVDDKRRTVNQESRLPQLSSKGKRKASVRSLESHLSESLGDDIRFEKVTSIAKKVFRTEYTVLHTFDECLNPRDNSGKNDPSMKQTCSFLSSLMPKSPEQVLVVSDCQKDERFKDSIFVTGAVKIRFYAGVPLFVNGKMIGILSIMDTLPRGGLDDLEKSILVDLAGLTSDVVLKSSKKCHQSSVESAKLMVR
jgi:GAF domain